jgi:hypothetical protein
MNTEPRGPVDPGNELDPADTQLQTRLARSFEGELARAERDYPALEIARAGGRSSRSAGRPGGAGGWPRLASGLVAVGVVAVIGLIGLGLAYRPGTAAGPATEPPRTASGLPSAGAISTDGVAIPSEIGGEKVFRATDEATFPTSGSFLLGGVFTRPAIMAPCVAPIGLNDAEQQLVYSCNNPRIDGLELAPSSTIDEPSGEILVARVHIHDPLAGQCSAKYAAQCAAAIVVESVVWRSNVVVLPTSTPTPEGSGEAGPSAMPSETAAHSPSIEPGSDGVPTSYDGATVYRASSLPALLTYLLGGVLGRDGSCTPATGVSADPPSCGYWTVDGLVVGNQVAISPSDVGSIVVVRIQVSRRVGTCVGNPCRTQETLVVTEVVWVGPKASFTPPPQPVVTPPPVVPQGT